MSAPEPTDPNGYEEDGARLKAWLIARFLRSDPWTDDEITLVSEGIADTARRGDETRRE